MEEDWWNEERKKELLHVGGIVCSVPLALVTARGGRHLSLNHLLHSALQKWRNKIIQTICYRKSRFRAGGYSWLKLERGVLCSSEKILEVEKHFV